jgi:hypothetical protein
VAATSLGAHSVSDPETGSTTVTEPVVGVAAVVVVWGGIDGWVDGVVPPDPDPVQEAASSSRAMKGRKRRIGGGEA